MNKLWVRLSVAFLFVTWIAIAMIALIVHDTTARSFRQYLNQRDTESFSESALTELESYYATNDGSWSGAEALLPRPGQGQNGGQGGGQGTGAGNQGRGRGGATILLADADGIVVAASDPEHLGSTLNHEMRSDAVELRVDDIRVGWLVQVSPGEQAIGEAEERFLSEADRWLVVAAAGGSLLAIVIGGLLAWQLTRPLRALTDAAHELAGGQLGQQVNVSGAAEIADLASAFNHMSHDLAHGETLRQRMAADIAHELRTPVSVLRGHLEAMIDGVFPLDTEHLAVAYDRTIHMTRLVDDLRLLTRAEAGQLPLERHPVAAGTLLRSALKSFEPLVLDANLMLDHEIAADLPQVTVDEDRIQQVLGNLLTNALRHTPSGGTLTIHAEHTGARVRVSVSNTGKGLTPEEAKQVFTPFWRAEDARERDKGGSGLGLAISQQLLLLHGGRIWAESAPDRAIFIFELPVTS